MSRAPLRIGITCFPTFGGSGVVATEIGMAMARMGHRVHFICYEVPRRLDRFMENIYFHEVEVHDYPLFVYPPYPISLASKLVEVSTSEKLDLMHMHYAVPHATSAYLAKQVLEDKSPKIITTLHGTDITLVGNERSYLPITRFSIVQSDGITTPSHYLKHATYDRLNVSTEVPIEVIPNFVDTNEYRPREADKPASLVQFLGCGFSNEKIITHVSNFRAVKRMHDVINIFHEINKQVPSHLILIGDGPERSKVEGLVRELQLQPRVCFLGKQESFVPVLQQSELFLLPSESESFGLAALEAMSCGVPVVASKVGGVPELITHGVNGFLADVGDVKAMAEFALTLLRDEEKQRAFSIAARESVLAKFEQSLLVKRYEDYYYRILGRE